MSGNSSQRVTVTLGRGGGRVVKRASGMSEAGGFSSGAVLSGSKRAVRERDRVVGDEYDRSQFLGKRRREESFGSSSLNDIRLDKGDLRFKLMKKNVVKQSLNSDSRSTVDLRDKLSSKNYRPPEESRSMRPPEASVSVRQSLHNHRDAGVTRYPVPEPRDVVVLRGTPSSRNSSDLSTVDRGRVYSSWTSVNVRQRSPEKLLRPSDPRELSPERCREAVLRRSAIRAQDGRRPNSAMRISPARAVRSSPFLTTSSVPSVPVQSAVRVPARYPQVSRIIQKIPSTADEHQTVDSLLLSLGLEKYAISFKAEEVDMNALRQMSDRDLKELGIPMGPRKKILQALMPRSRRLL